MGIAMPLDPLQREIAEVLKSRRSAKSFVGGSSVFNERFKRSSDDIDIYAEDIPIGKIAHADIATLAVVRRRTRPQRCR